MNIRKAVRCGLVLISKRFLVPIDQVRVAILMRKRSLEGVEDGKNRRSQKRVMNEMKEEEVGKAGKWGRSECRDDWLGGK